MAEVIPTKRHFFITKPLLCNMIAVVTGSNKGIGLEICRQLASKGVLVVLTARDEERGLEAVKSLKVSGFSDVVFHQLDVVDDLNSNMFRQPQQVNNAGVLGSGVKAEDRKNFSYSVEDITGPDAVSQKKFVNQTYEITVSCLRTNYYGTKHLTEALIPILEQSSSARIVNVSSTLGKLKFILNEKAKKELGDVDGLTEEKVEKLVEDFLEDVKNDLVETKHWPPLFSAYIVSKAALNAYTRILAKKYPKIATNAVCPGFTNTDINDSTGIFTVEEAARGPVMLALLPDQQRPSGCFFFQTEMSTF
ncbi:(+)-neomenthol dehydrogenase-like [Populus alba x Populus x berolinensis]|nr:(+)-neomenthol dehydrogenase-like [Populus alba x Populus x berolinensis]